MYYGKHSKFQKILNWTLLDLKILYSECLLYAYIDICREQVNVAWIMEMYLLYIQAFNVILNLLDPNIYLTSNLSI